MVFAISLWDLGLWLAVSSFLMLITSEISSPYHGRINLHIDLKRMKNIAIALGIAFLFVVSLKVISVIHV